MAIAFAVLALGIQAYRHARGQPRIGSQKIWIALGALVSAAIGAGVALIGFVFALALSLFPFVVANYRARKRHPKAVARRIIPLIATLDRVTLAVVAIVVVLVAFRTEVAAIKFPDVKHLQVDDDLTVGSCIARPPIEQGTPARVVSCHAPGAYGRVVKTPPLSFLEPACPARTDNIVETRSLVRPNACVVALSAPHPGAVGAGGGVIRRRDCIARPGRVKKSSAPGVVAGPVLHEVPCDSPSAYAHVLARVDKPERCPSATRKALFLEATDRVWVCIAPELTRRSARTIVRRPLSCGRLATGRHLREGGGQPCDK